MQPWPVISVNLTLNVEFFKRSGQMNIFFVSMTGTGQQVVQLLDCYMMMCLICSETVVVLKQNKLLGTKI
jgi:hypothetical protein